MASTTNQRPQQPQQPARRSHPNPNASNKAVTPQAAYHARNALQSQNPNISSSNPAVTSTQIPASTPPLGGVVTNFISLQRRPRMNTAPRNSIHRPASASTNSQPPSIVLDSVAAFAVPGPAVPAIPAPVAAVVSPPVTAVTTLPPVAAVAVPVPVAASVVPASVTATVPPPVTTSSAFTNPPAVGFMIDAELASQYTPEEIQAMLLRIERQEEELARLRALEDSQDGIMPDYDDIPDGSIPKPRGLARSNLQAVMGLQDDKDLYNEARDVVRGCVAHLKDQFLIEWCHQDPRFVQTIVNVANLRCPYLKRFRHGWATHEILRTTNKNKRRHKKVIQSDPTGSIRKAKAQARKMKLAQWALEREAEEAAMEQEQDNGGMQVEVEAGGEVEVDVSGNGGEVEVEGMGWVEEGAEGFVETAGAVADVGQADGVAIGGPGLDISPFDDKELSQGDDDEAIDMPDEVMACSQHNLTAQHHFAPFDITPDPKAPAITTQNTGGKRKSTSEPQEGGSDGSRPQKAQKTAAARTRASTRAQTAAAAKVVASAAPNKGKAKAGSQEAGAGGRNGKKGPAVKA
ncbi:hypothetical protein BJ165DRAFT_1548003 [Panaeolus papilionaceus]|nr:hypothetical protein BJ165DRAFT_1548003 [Panaeolus papilionaceus]